MDWQSTIDKINQPLQTTEQFNHSLFNLLQTVDTPVGEAALLEDGYGTAVLVFQGGYQQPVADHQMLDAQKLQTAIDTASHYITSSGNYMKDSKGVYVPVVIAPNGQKYPQTDYTNQGQTYDATGKPSQNTPTSGAGGSGGTVILVCNTFTGNTPVVTGGAAGNGGSGGTSIIYPTSGSGTAGTAGLAGTVITITNL